MKKLLAIVISMAMIVAMMPMGVFADEPANYITVNNSETKYTAFTDAVNAATPDENGVITYTVTGKVDVGIESAQNVWVQILSDKVENVSEVKFIGAGSDAELCITKKNNILADQKYDVDVSFSNLILSKTEIGDLYDIGHGGNYFTCWLRNKEAAQNTVTYTNCTFPNGVCDNQYGSTVFNNCNFTNSTAGKYNLWNYGGNTTLTGCTFTGTRGVKVYNEGTKEIYPTISVRNTTFSGLTEKTAVVVSKPANITLDKVEVTACTKGLFIRDITGNDELKIVGNGANISGTFNITAEQTSEDNFKSEINLTGGSFSTLPKEYVDADAKIYLTKTGLYNINDDTNTEGFNNWIFNEEEGYYEETYVAPVVPVTPSTPATPADNVTNDTTDKNTTADLTPAVSDNKSTTTVDNATADKIIDKAVENKSTEVIVDARGNNTVASSEVAIPEKTVKEISEKTDANLVIKTDNGQVDLDRTALAAVAEQAGTAGTVTLVVETVKKDENICHVDLKLVTSNGAVKDFKGGNVKVTINLDKELAAKELVCVYIDDNGIYTLVEGVLNADGTYTFTTGHFSEYAVMAKADADKVIADQLNTLIKEVNLKVRTSKTSKKNIKAVVSGDVKALTDAGYTVKYKFYRSEKKSSKYTAAKVKDTNTYINTVGKKGTKYYYKAKALVYDGDKLVGQTVLTQCRYGVRTWSK